MKDFLKYVLATIVGIVLLWFFLLILFGGIISSAVKNSMEEETVSIDPNSILKLDFATQINDRPNFEEGYISPMLPIDRDGNYGLRPILETIKHAKEDNRIRGIYIEPDQLSIGFANLTELVAAIQDFKESGKFVVSNSRYIGQKAYALASTADEVYIHPEGYIDFKGFASRSLYFKNALDRLGIEPLIFYAGKFKSATEPYRRTNMSEENKLQTLEFLEDIYTNYLDLIATNRSIDKEQLREIADNLTVKSPKDAVEQNLIDALKYDDEVIALLKEHVGVSENEDLNFISINEYSQANEITHKGKQSGDNRIAVVYAEGNITTGDRKSPDNIQGDSYAFLIRKLRKNDKIKAVVLRVNSPGGSAFDSDLIWRELELLKAEKPLIVSMGNYAASGGYYIAANSDRIFAEKSTITGSIGVFSTMFNTQKFLEKKLGITTDGVSTGKFSDFPNPNKPWTDQEKAIMQGRVDDIYSGFIGKVSEGRGLHIEQVHEIAQGRVWSGQDALEIGLVDEIGSLEDAINYAAEQAEISDPKISFYPEEQSEWERIQELFDLEARANKLMNKKLGEYGEVVRDIEEISTFTQPQMRMPYKIEIQ